MTQESAREHLVSADEDPLPLKAKFFAETKALLGLAAPLCVSLWIDMATFTIAVLFLGQLGAQSLAAGSLACSVANTTGWALGLGLLTAQDTLAAHAFGEGNIKRLAEVTHRAFIIVTLYCIPMGIIWSVSDSLLVLLGQDRDVARMSADVLLILIPGLFAAMWFEVIRRHQQAMNVVLPDLVVMVISIPIEVGLLWCSTFIFEFGYRGSAFSLSLLLLAQPFWLGAWTVGRPEIRRAWAGFSVRKAFRKWNKFLKLGISGALMTFFEDFGLDVLMIFAGWIGVVPLAVHSALIETYMLGFMAPFGVASSATTRVGNLLGAKNVPRAKLSFVISLVLSFLLEAVFGLVVYFGRPLIARAFCSDPVVIAEYIRVSPILSLLVLADGIQIAAAGTLRGIGKQTLGMAGNFAAFYLLGVPSGLLFAFHFKLGVLGLWLGFSVSVTSLAIFQTVFVLCTDWEQAAASLAEETQPKPTRPLFDNIRINTPAVRYLLP